MAQGYNCSYNKIELLSNFQKHLRSWGIQCGWGLDGCARWRAVTITVVLKFNWIIVFKIISIVKYTIGLGLGWLRAVTQGYNYSYNKTQLKQKTQMDLNRCGLKLSWGFDGGARWRKVTNTVTINLNWVVNLKGI